MEDPARRGLDRIAAITGLPFSVASQLTPREIRVREAFEGARRRQLARYCVGEETQVMPVIGFSVQAEASSSQKDTCASHPDRTRPCRRYEEYSTSRVRMPSQCRSCSGEKAIRTCPQYI